ncbi:MAG: DUF5719 family protein [Nocardioides sp.]
MSQTTPGTPGTPGRRSSRRGGRVNATIVLAIVLPVLCALALFLVRPTDPAVLSAEPTRTALSRASLVCPSGTRDVLVSSAADDVTGEVQVGLGEDRAASTIASGEVTPVEVGRGPVVVSGEDETAPGLVAARVTEDTAATCLPPTPTSWFTGVGTGAGHRSVLELTNPDSGTALADVTVYGRNGVVDAPRLRGVSVPGGTSVELDLATLVPRRDELSLEVVTGRGRIGATLLDRFDPVGRDALVTDWLPAQTEPATSHLLLGLAPGADARRSLIIANGGADQVLATLEVVTDDSVFTPKDVPELRIPPQSTARLELTGELAQLLEDGATGLQVTANEPVTASLRTRTVDDLSLAVPDPELSGAATVLLPEGGGDVGKELQLSGASGAGVVKVVARSSGGKKLAAKRVEVAPDRGYSVTLPSGAVLVTVTPARTTISGAVLVSGASTTVVPLRMPALNGLVPAVRPGLP